MIISIDDQSWDIDAMDMLDVAMCTVCTEAKTPEAAKAIIGSIWDLRMAKTRIIGIDTVRDAPAAVALLDRAWWCFRIGIGATR